jgi:nicotinamide riboside transporter PnuC
MFDVLFWCLTVLSIVGVVLNIQKDRNCFSIWMFTNASWAYIDFIKGIPQQAVLFMVYFCLAVWGYLNWSGKNA